MKECKVRILKASPPYAWYKDMVGEVFIVYRDRKDFVLKEDRDSRSTMWRHIVFEDCEVIE